MGSGLTARFGQVVRKRRRAAHLSQEALAERADVSRTYVSVLERGMHSPSLDIVSALATAFGCEPWHLIKEAQQTDEE